MKTQWDEYGNFLGKIPKLCVKECSHSGNCETDVKKWITKLSFHVPPELARHYLRQYGAWEDLWTCSQELLNERVLWLACCDLRETGEWFGLV